MSENKQDKGSQTGVAPVNSFKYCFSKKNIFIYLFLVVLGLHCCMWAFSRHSEQGLFSSCSAWALHRGGFSCCRAWALDAQASVVPAHGLSSCGTWALVAHAMWNRPGPGIKPMSPALAGGFPSSVPPGKLSFKYCYPPSIWTQFQTQLGFQKSN